LYGDPKQNNMCYRHYQQHLDETLTGASGRVSISRHHSALIATAPKYQQSEVNIKIPHASGMLIMPNTTTIMAPGREPYVFRSSLPMYVNSETAASGYANQGHVSVSPPSFPTPESLQGSQGLGALVTGIGSGEGQREREREQDLTLGATYNRVAGIQAVKCKTPGCGNFGNTNKAGFCNSCYKNEELVRNIVLGDEEIG
jgi:hypothetical protein